MPKNKFKFRSPLNIQFFFRRTRTSWCLFLLTLFFVCWLGVKISPVTAHSYLENSIAQTWVDAPQMLQQGKKLFEAGEFSQAVRIWQQAYQSFKSQRDVLNQAIVLSNLSMAYQQLDQWPQATEASKKSLDLLRSKRDVSSSERVRVLAQALNTQGSLQLAMGEAQVALATWKKATATYKRAGVSSGEIGGLLNQAQAMQSLGLYLKAKDTLIQVQQNLASQPDSVLKTEALHSLGKTLRVVGDLKQARNILEQSLAMAQRLKSPLDITASLLSLGNTARSQPDNEAALIFFERAADAPASPIMHIQAQVNQLSLLVETKSGSDAKALWPQIQAQLATLSPSRAAIYARVNFAQSLSQLKLTSNEKQIPDWVEIAQTLAPAVSQAKALGDQRAEAYALGAVGGLYEHTQQWAEAEKLTKQALILAQAINAPDIGYRLQWQLGRLLKSQGNLNGAIAAYTESISDLKSLRNSLVGVNPDIQFSFRDQVEPIYRQLVDLLLRPKRGSEPSQENLSQAREVIESLQIAELNNFFQFACLDANPVEIDQVVNQQDPTAAVLYPIILPDRLEVILKLPNLPLLHYKSIVSQHEFETVLEDLRTNLSQPENLYQAQALSKQIYEWLMRPAEESLGKSKVKIKTLVFVLDGHLRNIPMSALYDGREYLVEKYATALAPGLKLITPNSTKKTHFKALTGGISEERSGFPSLPNAIFSSLPNVRIELAEIKSKLNTTELLNEEFKSKILQKRLNSNPFSVVHFATHGQFSSQANKTFILAWDGPLFVDALNTLLQSRDTTTLNPLELLVLSACDTAAGDNRAVLGLAGVAVRAGARSTLATLWAVKDDSTSILMSHFYHNLVEQHLSKSEALRQAQLALLKNPNFRRSMSWVPFILLGNWI